MEGLFNKRFNSAEMAVAALHLVQFDYVVEKGTITSVGGMNNANNKKLHEIGIYPTGLAMQIVQLINWLIDAYQSKPVTKVKTMFAHQLPILNNTGQQQFITYLIFNKQQSNLIQFNISKQIGLSDKYLKNIRVLSESGNNHYNLDYVISNFNFEVILKKHSYQVLKMLISGFTSEEIASMLNLSAHTVNDYRKELLKTFSVSNMYQLIKRAKENSII